jgi:hypothetical protein
MSWSRSAVLCTFALASLDAGHRPSARAWPWFLLVRGPGIERPIVIGRRMGDVEGDVIRLKNSLQVGVSAGNDFVRRTHYEVAEFWGQEWFPDTAGRPQRQLRFADAGTFATIYIGTSTLPPVWVGRSEGRDGVAQTIGLDGQQVLARAGVKLR